MKALLSGGIVRDFRFSSAAAYVDYLDRLRSPYRILDSCSCEDGSILVRIVSAYNSSPLIQLEGGDQDDEYSFTANVFDKDGFLIKSFVHKSFEPFDIKLYCLPAGIQIYSPYADGKLRTTVNAGYSVSGLSDSADLSHIFLVPYQETVFSDISTEYVFDFYFVEASDGASGVGGSFGDDSSGSSAGAAFAGFGDFVLVVLSGFLSFSIAPGFTFGSIFEFVVYLALFLLFLKLIH